MTNWVTLRLRRLPHRARLGGPARDEIAAARGINTTNTKLTAFAIGAGFGRFAGSFFAARQGFISRSFTFIESAVVLAIVVLGGMGSQIGVAIAAIALIGGTEILRSWTGSGHLRPGLRPDPVPHAAVRTCHGAGDDLEAAWADLLPLTVDLPAREEEGAIRPGQGGARLMEAASTCSASSI
jgi:hypothetical protein